MDTESGGDVAKKVEAVGAGRMTNDEPEPRAGNQMTKEVRTPKGNASANWGNQILQKETKQTKLENWQNDLPRAI
jgi:hypothetical protein